MRFLKMLILMSVVFGELAWGGTVLAAPSPQATVLPPEMIGVVWNLTSLERSGANVPQGPTPVTLEFFAAERVTGGTGCNSYSGAYTTQENNSITFSPVASTRMFCEPPEVMTFESEYLAALESINEWQLNGQQLELRGTDTVMRFDNTTNGEPATGTSPANSLPATGTSINSSSALFAVLGLLLVGMGLLLAQRAV